MSRYSSLPKISLPDGINKFTQGYKTIRYPEVPQSDNDIWVLTTVGDRLDILANDFYGDDSLWWVISIANPDKVNFGSIYLTPGIEIRIPINYDQIVSSFLTLNK
jgi:hypothetical protein